MGALKGALPSFQSPHRDHTGLGALAACPPSRVPEREAKNATAMVIPIKKGNHRPRGKRRNTPLAYHQVLFLEDVLGSLDEAINGTLGLKLHKITL